MCSTGPGHAIIAVEIYATPFLHGKGIYLKQMVKNQIVAHVKAQFRNQIKSTVHLVQIPGLITGHHGFLKNWENLQQVVMGLWADLSSSHYLVLAYIAMQDTEQEGMSEPFN